MIDNVKYEVEVQMRKDEEEGLRAEERDACIEARAKERLSEGGDCYPWKLCNIFEALAECDYDDESLIGCAFNAARKLPDNSFSQRLVVEAIEDVVNRYWERTAIAIEEREYRD